MANRPTKLGRAFVIVLFSALLVSFISGVLLWYASRIRQQTFEPPQWYQLCRIVHGVVNPLICACFGYLCCTHIPGGWRMAVNQMTGGPLVFVMAILIGTGVGLYYANERAWYYWTHVVLGGLLPVLFGWHWVAARKWVRSTENGGRL